MLPLITFRQTGHCSGLQRLPEPGFLEPSPAEPPSLPSAEAATFALRLCPHLGQVVIVPPVTSGLRLDRE
jgi:hypothetical protein